MYGRRMPARPAGAPSGPSSSLVMQLVLLIGVAAFVFMAGVIVGVQFFDVHRAGTADDSRPWAGLVKVNMQPPKGEDAKGGRHGRLRRAEATDEDEAGADSEGGELGASTEDGSDSDAGSAQKAAAATFKPPPPPEHYGTFGGRGGVEMSGAGDASDVSFGAWIYLDSRDRSDAIKTIASNRHGGCRVDNNHRGYSFFVNNWETGDRALVLEWRNSGAGAAEGCARLSSEAGSIPYDSWVHVGFAFDSKKGGKAMLFINGRLLRSGPSGRETADVMRGSGAVHLHLGSTADGQYGFIGRIAHVFVSHGVVTPRQLTAAVALTDLDGWASMAAAGTGRLLASIVLSPERVDAPSPSESADSDSEPPAPRVSASSGMWVLELTGKMPAIGTAGGKRRAAVAAAEPAAAEDDGWGAKAAAGGGSVEEAEAPAAKKPAVRKPAAAAGAGGKRAAKAAAPAAAAAGGDDSDGAAAGPATTGAKYEPGSSIEKIPSSIRRGRIPGTLPSGSFDFRSGGNQWVPRMIRVPAAQASGSVDDPAALAAGTFSDEVTLEQLAESDAKGRTRAEAVKGAMVHVWAAYRKHAWGKDELKPRSGQGQDNWAGVGMTLVDSLDTLWVMGMMDEFKEATEWVRTSLDFNKHQSISVFETTIRALGGLLSAYDLSKERVFLDKARDLGDRLLPAFNTPSGIPRSQVVLATGSTSNFGWTGGASILAELGTLQVEFRYLSKATGEPSYGRKAEAVIEKMEGVKPAHGLYPIYISSDNGQPTTSHVTFGALGDSFYEYLIKVWVQGGRKEPMYRRMYDAAMQGLTDVLLKRSEPSKLAYVADWTGSGTEDKMDHLVCFVPGMLALGAYTATGTDGEAHAVRDLTNAKALAYTCYQMYERQATGIAPEFVTFPGGRDLEASGSAPFYILRPEAAEALYVLHQLTGNPVYREWGWKMFQAIDKYCKTEFGYGAHPDVRDPSRQPDDRMESFFLAETLKYLYMLQSPDHIVSLDKYVFNTEAHPLAHWED